MIPEPTNKLDAAAALVGVVSGSEGEISDWGQIDWRQVEDHVRRLRHRIFTASKAGDLPRVRRLQRLMLRSRANTLHSVRRVTERNAGRLTAGVDGEVVLTPEAKLELVRRVQHPTEIKGGRPGGLSTDRRATRLFCILTKVQKSTGNVVALSELVQSGLVVGPGQAPAIPA